MLSPAKSRAVAPAVELTLLGVPKPAGDDAEDSDKKPSPDENVLPPTAAFGLRFASPMVAADQVGEVATESPLVFTPELPGSFRWTSQRGGVYTLSEPPPLGAAYEATLRAGLKAADGQPVAGSADFRRTFRMPGLEISAVVLNGGARKDLPVRPRVRLIFNSAVHAAKVAPAFSFRGPGGKRVAAQITAAPENTSSASRRDATPRTWREQIPRRARPGRCEGGSRCAR